jgi:hypothetical protein
VVRSPPAAEGSKIIAEVATGSIAAVRQGIHLAGLGVPAVRTGLSALIRTWVLSGCCLAKKLKATNAAQNNRLTRMILRCVRLWAL